MNRYFTIDVIKVILALFIVMLHSPVLTANDEVNKGIAGIYSIAVPLFFCFSGFFFRKTGSKCGKTVKRILILYLFWLIPSFPLILGQRFNEDLTIIQYIQQFVFSSSYSVSWYLVAMIWCVIICYITRKLNPSIVFIIAVFLYTLCVCHLWLRQLVADTFICSLIMGYQKVFGTVVWSFPQGLIYFLIGYNFDENKVKNKNSSWLWTIGLLSLSLVLYFCEIYCVEFTTGERTRGYMMMPLLVYSIFNASIYFSHPTMYVEEGKMLRNVSTLLYLSHPIIMAIGFKLFGFTGIQRFWFVLLIFAIMCPAYFYLKKKTTFHWLKYAC